MENRTHRSATPPPDGRVPGPDHESGGLAHRLSGYRDRLVRLAYRFVFNASDAEDAAHDALSKALDRIDQLRDPDRLWSWLARILVTTCSEKRRSKTVRMSGVLEAIEPPDPAADHREAIELSERQKRLVSLIDRLPARQREVLVLRHLEGMSFAEVASVLEMNESTARVQAQNARERLRSLVSEVEGGAR